MKPDKKVGTDSEKNNAVYQYFFAGSMLVATVVSAYSAYSSSVIAEKVSRWQQVDARNQEVNDNYADFFQLLSLMQQLEQQAVTAYTFGTAPCQSGNCLGVLSFSPDYVSEYEIYTNQAIDLFSEVKPYISSLHCLRLANACYVLGKLDHADKYAAAALEVLPC